MSERETVVEVYAMVAVSVGGKGRRRAERWKLDDQLNPYLFPFTRSRNILRASWDQTPSRQWEYGSEEV